MSGAIRLSGRAALLSGAGLVRLAVPEGIGEIVAAETPDYMTATVPADIAGRITYDALNEILSQTANVGAVGFGPGLGRSLGLELFAARLFVESCRPTVFDADGLNALAAREFFIPAERRVLFPPQTVAPAAPRILTPHPGEFARLRGIPTPADPEGRKEAAVDFVRTARSIFNNTAEIVLVLKGAGTVVTDGERVFVNETGNPGMATGGSGDVLTGILTAFLARKIEPFDAATLAVALHGLAGDCAAEILGEESLTASEIVNALPGAFKIFGSLQQR